MAPFKLELVNTLRAECNEKRLEMLDGVLADNMYPVHEWPAHCIRLFLGKHLRFAGIPVINEDKSYDFTRFDLICFLLGNNMMPETLVEWLLAQNGYIRTYGSAMDVAEILEKHGKGELDGKKIWNVELKEHIPLTTPSMAYDLLGRRVRVAELKEDGTAKLDVNGEQVYTWVYSPPGSYYWKHAVAILKAHAMTLPRD